MLTPQNNTGLTAILALRDSWEPSIEAFAAEHAGQRMSFPETVTALNLRGGTTTRFDLGISPGDDPENATRGPA